MNRPAAANAAAHWARKVNELMSGASVQPAQRSGENYPSNDTETAEALGLNPTLRLLRPIRGRALSKTTQLFRKVSRRQPGPITPYHLSAALGPLSAGLNTADPCVGG